MEPINVDQPDHITPKERRRRRNISAALKRKFADPAFRQRHVEALKRATNTPEIREKRRETSRRCQFSPEVRAAIAERTRQQWKRRSVRRKMIKGIRANPTRQTKSETQKAIWSRLTPEQRKSRIEKAAPGLLAGRAIAADKLRNFLATPEGRRHWSKNARLSWADPEKARNRIEGGQRYRADLKAKLAELENLKSRQIGRPRTMDGDSAKHGPRIVELRKQGKSWSQVQTIMNRETGISRSTSGWRHFVDS